MRIVAGERKGARLDVPAGRDTRPTSDRLRESLFAILGDVSGLTVLDPFAGTGALGLEALSRGAARAGVLRDSGPALRALRANVERLGYGDRAQVRRQDGRRRMAADARAGVTYELLLLDPPYRMLAALQEDFPCISGVTGSRRAGGDRERQPTQPPLELPLVLDTTRVQGAARLTVYRNELSGSPSAPAPTTRSRSGTSTSSERAATVFDRVVVGVVRAPRHKQTMFTLEERIGFIEQSLAGTATSRWQGSARWWSSSPGSRGRVRSSRGCGPSPTSSGSSR